ncbi:hypothetical protein K402DRAFT_392251 [Aulographum hederae CBS 113979]|uniref:Carboxylesterase family protein n=1 Tax=Aulographum hederae CBS 113979 TaxID=1176131 RepID=A0A6G1H433_9PEZI|nr:hypothetical protein K402DRAFT_392251 [Aulographum hederae CBS 113979]
MGPRKTRAALRAEAEANENVDTIHNDNTSIDNAESAPLPSESSKVSEKDRIPLGRITPNSISSGLEEEAEEPTKKKKATKGARKGGKKGKKGGKVEEIVEEDDNVKEEKVSAQAPTVGEDVTEEPAKPVTRKTRQQAAKEEEAMAKTQVADTSIPEEKDKSEEQSLVVEPATTNEPVSPAAEEPQIALQERHAETNELQSIDEEPEGPSISEDVSTVQEPSTEAIETNSEGGQQPDASAETSTPVFSVAVAISTPVEDEVHEYVESAAPAIATREATSKSIEAVQGEQLKTDTSRDSKSPSLSFMRPEDSIAAIDALEDALEEVGKVLPSFDPSSPVKPTRPRSMAATSKSNRNSVVAKPPPTAKSATSKPPTRSTGAPSMVKGKPNAFSASTTLTRSTSVRTKPTNPATAKKEASRNPQSREPKVVDYLAEKRRPVSISFPTPPPPPKSKKELTRSTFQLPGEAVAAKLRAAREERQKREEEEKEKKAEQAKQNRRSVAFGSSINVKPTAASRARESLIAGAKKVEPGKDIANQPASKRSSVAGVSAAAGASTAAKRSSALMSKRGSIVIGRGRPNPDDTTLGAQGPMASSFTSAGSAPNAMSRSSSLRKEAISQKRSSLTFSSSTEPKQRVPSISAAPKSVVTAADAALQRMKAREIFNRDRKEKEAKENEKREKEESARRARAQAAERGRQASREWAEKQKKKMGGGSAEGKKEVVA